MSKYLYRNLTERNIKENKISPMNPDEKIPLPSFIRSASRGGKTSQSQYVSMTSSLGTIWKWNNNNSIAIITKDNFDYCINKENILDLRTSESFENSINKNKEFLIKEGLDEERYPGSKYQEWAFKFSSSSKEIVFQKQTIDGKYYEVIDSDILNKVLEVYTVDGPKFKEINKSEHNKTSLKHIEKWIDEHEDFLTEKILDINYNFKNEIKNNKNFIKEYDDFSSFICNKAYSLNSLTSWKKKNLGFKTLAVQRFFEWSKDDPEKWLNEKFDEYKRSYSKKLNISKDLLQIIITEDYYTKEYERKFDR